MHVIAYMALGLLAGISSGFLGIGGGVILVPALVYLFGLSQHQAQGTTLALMIPPIGLLAALKYYQQGNVNLQIAVFVCLGFFLGGLVGANFAMPIPDLILRKTFGVFLMCIALRMILVK